MPVIRKGEPDSNSDTMGFMGYILIVAGAFLVGITGIFFYQYIQNAIAAGLSSSSGSSSSTAAALNIYNGTANMPIFITMSIFGVASLIMGAIFVAGGHISENLTVQAADAPSASAESESLIPRPSRACTKCGSLVYRNTAYCPDCGSPLGRIQSVPPTAA
jgi:hypothetical protein